MASHWRRNLTTGLARAAAVWAFLLLPTLVEAQSGAFLSGETRRQGIDHHTRLVLVRARVEGKTQGIVLLATTRGSIGAVADSVRRWGGVVQARFDEVGYLRVQLPLAAFGRVQALPSVVEAYLSAGCQDDRGGCGLSEDTASRRFLEDWYARQRGKRKAAEANLPSVPPAARRAASPYTPVADMGIARLRAAHPTYDGRGVTIGIVEGGVDVTHPALQTARSLTGASLPKVRGVLTPDGYDPLTAPDPTLLYEREPNERQALLRDTATVEASTGVVTIAGESYHVAPGRYAVGRFTLIRDLYIEGSSWPSYGVVWDPARRLVWVDTDRDHDFRDEAPLSDINTRFSAGLLRRDSTAADPAPAIGFAVSFDSVGNRLRILPGQYVHHTMVSSVAAGAQLLGGAAGGAAPGAQLVSVNNQFSSGELIEAFVRALRDPRIDLLSCSGGAGDAFLATGDAILSLIVRRAIARYRKPVFLSAGNGGPLIQALDEITSGDDVLTVGASATRATLQAHFGWNVPLAEQLEAWSNRGPTRDGALKPDLLAPPFSIVAQPCGTYVGRGGLTYRLPPCYGVGGGTSAAAPAAAGAAAVLLSAAKQAGVPHDVARVNWALTMGARTLPGAQVHEQGNGVIDVGRAWELLRMPVDLPTIVTAAPVVTTLNRYLRVPGVGRGILEREGWRAGQRAIRTITLTRTAGGRETYRLRWHGNDGTFSIAQREVALPLGRPVAVPVTIAPASAGVHSAALELVDPVHDVPVHRVAATVVAAEPFTAANQYTVRDTLQVPWPGSRSVFVDVPAGATALRIDLRVRRGKVQLLMDDGSRGGGGRINDPTWMHEGKAAGERMTRLVQHPTPGVWELSVIPNLFPTRDDGPRYRVPAEAELVVTLLGAEAALPPIGFTNRLGPVSEGQIVTTLGARRVVTERADSARGPVVYTVAVDSGTTTLRVGVTPTDTTANLELHLYDCTSGRCTLWDINRRLSAAKSLLVHAPAPGTWKVAIDPARVGPGGTPFAYTEIQTGAAYGSVTATPHSPESRPDAGTPARSWATRVAVSPAPGPVLAGRDLVVVADLIDAAAERGARAHPFGTAPGQERVSHAAIIATTVVASSSLALPGSPSSSSEALGARSSSLGIGSGQRRSDELNPGMAGASDRWRKIGLGEIVSREQQRNLE